MSKYDKWVNTISAKALVGAVGFMWVAAILGAIPIIHWTFVAASLATAIVLGIISISTIESTSF